MEEAERAAAGKLLQPCSAKTRKRGADDDQSDPHRRVYRSDHAVPVPRLRARITGLLATQGIGLPPGTDIGAAAKTVRLWDGSPVPAALRARLEREWEHAQFLRTWIPELERERQRAIAHGRGETIDEVRPL